MVSFSKFFLLQVLINPAYQFLEKIYLNHTLTSNIQTEIKNPFPNAYHMQKIINRKDK